MAGKSLTTSAKPASAAIRRSIHVVRDCDVMLDSDLASLYGVETRQLIQAVRRNSDRFPADFMFQLTKEETEALRSQIGISKEGRGGRRYSPYVFTEQGVAMLSSVLRSKQAVAVNVEIMRAFVELRRTSRSQQELARRLDELERELRGELGAHEAKIAAVIKLLSEATITKPRKHRAGFVPPDD